MREYEWHGLIIGDADAAARAIDIATGAAYQAYVRRSWVRYRKPPGPGLGEGGIVVRPRTCGSSIPTSSMKQ